jgi:hypothetical protein
MWPRPGGRRAPGAYFSRASVIESARRAVTFTILAHGDGLLCVFPGPGGAAQRRARVYELTAEGRKRLRSDAAIWRR